MQLITPPLQQTAQGNDIKNLHYILYFLVQKLNDPNLNKQFNDPDFRATYKTDVFNKLYGSSTTKLVFFLQEFLQEHGFKMGVVDDITAEKMNELLKKFKGLNIDKPEGYPFDVDGEPIVDENKFTISGTLTGMEKNGLPQINVSALEYDIAAITSITATTTDDKGKFSFSFIYNKDLAQGDHQTNPDIIFQLVDPNQREIPIAAVYIVSLDTETLVDKLSDAKQAPVVLMNVSKEITIRIVADLKEHPVTEFERMLLLLNPFMGPMNFANLKEDDNNFQVSFLSKESGVDKIIIEALKNAFINERNTQLPAWAFFGLDRLPFDYADTKNVTIDAMVSLLTPLQPASSPDDLKALAERLLEFAREKTALEHATTLKVAVGEVLNPVLEAPEKLGKLIDAYARFEGDDIAKFWDQQSAEPDLQEIIPQVQYSLQLAQLTFNNTDLMLSLRERSGNVKELVKLENDEWLHLITEHKDKIPAHIEGENEEEKAKNYANGIQKFMEVSFPNEYITKTLSKEPAIDLPLLRRVASLNPGTDIINNVSATLDLTGLNDDQKKQAADAIAIIRKETTAYPAYGDMLTKNNVLTNPDIQQFPNTVRSNVRTFLANNQEFDISQTPFDAFIKDKKDSVWTGIENRQVVADQVRSMQRIHSVTANTTDMDILLQSGFHSAFQIAGMAQYQFVEGMSAIIPATTAQLYYQKASKITASTTMLYHHFYELGAGTKPKLGFSNNDGDEAAAIKSIPEWETLFGSLDTCQCRDCLSVYSPAAYFVDLLNIKNGFIKNNNVYTTLFNRRPDLQYIKLSCENTNTLIPYIDLVNEILETYIANGKLAEKTTIDSSNFTAAELAANPQHPTVESEKAFTDAYDLLKNARYPAVLPFDLPLETARKFLQEQGSSRYEVTKTFKKDNQPQTQASIEAEHLQLSAKEFELLTGNDFSGTPSVFIQSNAEYFGFTANELTPVLALKSTGHAVEIVQKKLNALGAVPKVPVDGNFGPLTQTALKQFQLNNALPQTGQTDSTTWAALFPGDDLLGSYTAYVNEFLERTTIAYTELIDLLNTQLLNADKLIILALVVPDGIKDPVLWASAHACDLDHTRLLHQNGDVLTGNELSLFARFIRLWKKLNLPIRDLDIIVTGLNATDITADVLLALPGIIDMSQNLRIPVEQLMVFWSNIQTWDKKSLYEKMFSNKAALQPDTIFELNAAGKQLQNTTELVADHIPSLLAAFKITAADLDLIFEAAAINSTADQLTIEVISTIYRHVLLAKAVKLSVTDLVNLLKLTAIAPWGNVSSVVAFIQLAEKCRQSGFTIAQLSYIYLHTTGGSNTYLPSPDMVSRIAKDLREGFLKILDDTAIKDDTVSEAFLKDQLGVIFDGEQAASILITLKDSTFYEVPLSGAFTNLDAITASLSAADKYLIGKLKYEGVKTKERLIFQGAMTDNEQIVLQNLPGNANYKTAIATLLQQPRKTLAFALSGFLNTADVDNLVNNNITETDKFKVIYKKLFSFILNARNELFIKQQLSYALKTDATVIDALMEISNTLWGDKIKNDILPLAKTGLWGTYFDNANKFHHDTVDEQINKNWGLGSENNSVDQFKVVWTGKMEVPKTEAFTFIVKKDSDSIVDLVINGVSLQWVTQTASEWTSETIALKTGELHGVTLTYTEGVNDALVALYWSSPTIPPVVVPTQYLYPSSPFHNFYRLFIGLQKITSITGTIPLTPAEIIYFSNNKTNFSGFDLSLLPTEKPAIYVPDAFNQLLRLLDYKTVRAVLPAAENSLIEIFTSANIAFQFGESIKLIAATADNDKKKKGLFEQLVEKIIRVTGWKEPELRSLMGNDIVPMVKNYALSGGYFDVQPGDFKNEMVLLNLWKCLSLADRIGVSVAKIGEWVSSPVDFTQVQDIKRTLRAKYGETDWVDVSKAVNDKLRVKQRDALVAYILTLPALKKANVRDTNGLYSYFLIDVEMDACMQTSRIKQAISSVQSFFQRCLMNLEQNILPTEINKKEWGWMKNYRLWEANRRIFLYPENWIEPELRDNKTPFFKELESELLQNEINNDNVEKVFMNYLEKLDDVAKLDICGLYEDTEAMEVHVFGRTLNVPSIYYYRKLNQQTNIWTAWEKVQLDIQGTEEGNHAGVHLIPVVWNRRLYLFWPIFREDAERQTAIENQFGIDGKKMWQLKFAWSEYRQKKWAPKKITKELLYSKSMSFDNFKIARCDDPNLFKGDNPCYLVYKFFRHLPEQYEHLFKLSVTENNIVINVYRNIERIINGINLGIQYIDGGTNYSIKVVPDLSTSLQCSRTDLYGTFTFTGCHNKVEIALADGKINLLPPPGTISFYQEFASTQQIATKLELTDIPKTTVPLLGLSQGIYQLLKSNIISKTGYYNFFYDDKLRTYYVTPEGFMRQRSDFKEVEKTDFKTLTTATALVKEKYVGHTLLTAQTQPANGVVLQPDVLQQNGIAVNPAINNLALTKTSLSETKELALPIVPYLNFTQIKFTFHPHYHGYVCAFMKALNHGGIDELLTLKSQLQDSLLIFNPNPFDVKYQPDTNNITRPHPYTHVEFEQTAAYGQYNWELFFHIPMLIANRLSKNQRFEEANRWYQFIFNPTTDTPVFAGNESTRYWNVLPFTQTPKETIQELMNKLQSKNSSERSEIETAIEAWRNDPFNPHLVARMRLIAYMKNTVMKYLDNLIEWGDQLFGRDTIESINEATQLYIMAAEILGRYPQKIPAKGQVEPKSFSELKGSLDAFSNAMVKMETIFPFFTMGAVNNLGGLPATATSFVSTLYFCIPDNDKLLSYWDLVGDRLFKIRHCQNIDGLERQLALFEPRIDPALLVRAVANGIDINSLLNEINAPLPHYRFSYMIEKALQMCSYLTSIGASYLSALEKKDAEELSMLKASQETTMQGLIKEIKQLLISEATRNREGLEKTKEVIQTRFEYYTGLVATGLIESEKEHLNKLGLAKERQDEAALVEITANLFHLVPDISVSVSIPGPGGSVGSSYGGSNIASALTEWGRYISFLAAGYTYEANSSSINSVNERRAIDWGHQQKLAAKELQQIDKQILSSQIREDISTKDLSNQEQQIENAQLTEEFLRNKFTNQELFGWMIGEMATCFFPYYQLVYAWAKAAERCYRFELGVPNTNFISFGYWDSFRKGLMAGEKLQLALKQMEQSYIECNKREYELTKHISLLQTNPLALLALKETGSCIIELPESLFDMDYPGQFMRKIKSVSISIPCVVGPYTSINCTLTLLKSKLRMKNILQAGTYAEQEDDPRFETRSSAADAIATSHAQNDPGMFELNFRDERFLPFEGAGAISYWRIKMPKETNQFNTDTVSDLILHLKYTAREGGKLLTDTAINEMNNSPKTGNRLFSLKHEFPNEWYGFLNPADPTKDQVLSINLDGDRFPYLVSSGNFTITNIAVLVDSAAASIPVLSVTSPGNTSKPYTFSKVPVKYGPLFTGHPSTEWAAENPGTWKLINPSTNAIKITKDNCNDIVLVVSYEKT